MSRRKKKYGIKWVYNREQRNVEAKFSSVLGNMGEC
jgi:hypothetical protein